MATDTEWFKIYPARWLGAVQRINDESLRGDCLLVLMHCLNEGGIKNTDDELSWITSLPVERIRELRPFLNRLSADPDADVYQARLVEEARGEKQAFVDRKTEAAKKRWSAKQSESEQKRSEPMHSNAPALHSIPEDMQTNADAMQCISSAMPVSHTDIQTYRQTEGGDARAHAHVHAREEIRPPVFSAVPKTHIPVNPGAVSELDEVREAVREAFGWKLSLTRRDSDILQEQAQSLAGSGVTPAQVAEYAKARTRAIHHTGFAADLMTWLKERETKPVDPHANLSHNSGKRRQLVL